MRFDTLPPIVSAGEAKEVTDSLGRSWSSLKHPRGRDGRFIRTFHEVRSFLHDGDSEPWMTGSVVAINSDGTIRVKVNHTMTPNLTDPHTGGAYVGHEVDVAPETVESIGEKAVLDAPGTTPQLSTHGVDKLSVDAAKYTDFLGKTDLGDYTTASASASADLKALDAFEAGGADLNPRAKYQLALYAYSQASDSPDDPNGYDEFKYLLDDLGVPDSVTDDTPDGMSGLAYLAAQFNGQNVHAGEADPYADYTPKIIPVQRIIDTGLTRNDTLREATLVEDPTLRLAWYKDGKFGVILADGEQRYNVIPAQGDRKTVHIQFALNQRADNAEKNLPGTPTPPPSEPPQPPPSAPEPEFNSAALRDTAGAVADAGYPDSASWADALTAVADSLDHGDISYAEARNQVEDVGHELSDYAEVADDAHVHDLAVQTFAHSSKLDDLDFKAAPPPASPFSSPDLVAEPDEPAPYVPTAADQADAGIEAPPVAPAKLDDSHIAAQGPLFSTFKNSDVLDDGVSDAQLVPFEDSIDSYTGYGHEYVNSWLRDTYHPWDEEQEAQLEEQVAELDAAIDLGVIPGGTTTYRGVRISEDQQEYLDALVSGDTVTDDGYMSMTTDPSVAEFFANMGSSYDTSQLRVIYEIKIPQQGAHGLSVDAHHSAVSIAHGENEIIGPRSTGLKVYKISKIGDNTYHAQAELVPAEEIHDDAGQPGANAHPEAHLGGPGEQPNLSQAGAEGTPAEGASAQVDSVDPGLAEALSDAADTGSGSPFQVLADPGASGDGYYPATDGSKLWGKYGASGVMVRHVDSDGTERFLLVQRGPIVSSNKGKWQLPGGALDANENDYQGAAREIAEELDPPAGFLNSLTPAGEVPFNHPSGWHYTNIAADAPDTFEPHVDGHETGDAGWFTREEIAALPLHPALQGNLDKLFAQFPDKPAVDEEPVPPPTYPAEAGVHAPAPAENVLIDATDWKQVGAQAGSNLGGVFEAPDGQRYYVKDAKTPSHARNEVLAGKLYQEAGVSAAKVELADTPFGAIGTASTMVDGAKADLGTHLSDQEYLAKIQDGFAVDAWLANRDIAGQAYDNVVTDKDGNPIRVDPGGALWYRAMGSPKGAAFGDEVGELDTFMSSSNASSRLFKSMSEDAKRESAKKVVAISPERIDELVDSAGFDPDGPVDAEKLKQTLKNRRKYIANRYGLELPENAASPAWTPPQQVAAGDLAATLTDVFEPAHFDSMTTGDGFDLPGGYSLTKLGTVLSLSGSNGHPIYFAGPKDDSPDWASTQADDIANVIADDTASKIVSGTAATSDPWASLFHDGSAPTEPAGPAVTQDTFDPDTHYEAVFDLTHASFDAHESMSEILHHNDVNLESVDSETADPSTGTAGHYQITVSGSGDQLFNAFNDLHSDDIDQVSPDDFYGSLTEVGESAPLAPDVTPASHPQQNYTLTAPKSAFETDGEFDGGKAESYGEEYGLELVDDAPGSVIFEGTARQLHEFWNDHVSEYADDKDFDNNITPSDTPPTATPAKTPEAPASALLDSADYAAMLNPDGTPFRYDVTGTKVSLGDKVKDSNGKYWTVVSFRKDATTMVVQDDHGNKYKRNRNGLTKLTPDEAALAPTIPQEDGLPGPDSDNWAAMVDETGPYRWDADGNQLHVGDQVVAHSDGQVWTVVKFESNNKGVVVQNAAGEKKPRNRLKLSKVVPAESVEESTALQTPPIAPEEAPEPTPTSPIGDVVQTELGQGTVTAIVPSDTSLHVVTATDGSLVVQSSDGSWSVKVGDKVDYTAPNGVHSTGTISDINPLNGKLVVDDVHGAPISVWPSSVQKNVVAPPPTPEPTPPPPTAFDTQAELAKVNDIPKNVSGVLQQFAGQGLTPDQVKQYRNAGYALDDAASLEPGSNDWLKAVNKALYNLNQAGPAAQPKLDQVLAWKTNAIVAKSQENHGYQLPDGYAPVPDDAVSLWKSNYDGLAPIYVAFKSDGSFYTLTSNGETAPPASPSNSKLVQAEQAGETSMEAWNKVQPFVGATPAPSNVAEAPAPSLTVTAPDASLQLPANQVDPNGYQLKVGDTIYWQTKGHNAVITGFEKNGKPGVFVLKPDGSKGVVNHKYAQQTDTSAPKAVPQTGNTAATSVTSGSPLPPTPPLAPEKPKYEPDPGHELYGAPKPEKPVLPDASDAKFVPQSWVDKVDAFYQARMQSQGKPAKPIAQSTTFGELQKIVDSGNIAVLEDWLKRGRISQELFTEAKTEIDQRTTKIKAVQDTFTSEMKDYVQKLKEWRKANGFPALNLKGLYDGTALEWGSISEARKWLNTHMPAGSLGPGGTLSPDSESAVGSQKGSTVGMFLRETLKEKSIDPTAVAAMPSSKNVFGLDKAMTETPPAPADFLVLRTNDVRAFIDPDTGKPMDSAHMSKIAGTIQHDWGFAETVPGSLAKGASPTYGSSRKVLMSIRVPAGTRAIWTNTPGYHWGSPGEHGLILERGLAYYIHKVEYKGGKWHVDAEIIPKAEVDYAEFGHFMEENPFQ